jgi:fructokinase
MGKVSCTSAAASILRMTTEIWVLGEALMDCIAQADGSLRPLIGGSNFNLARAASLRGAAAGLKVRYLNPLSNDRFGQQMRAQLLADGVQVQPEPSKLPTSLAVVQLSASGQPSYGFYREGVADRDYSADGVLAQLRDHARAAGPGILATGCLALVPPEHEKVAAILQGARAMGWKVALDVNLRPKVAADPAAYLAAVRQVLPLADWLKASDEDLENLGIIAKDGSQSPQAAPETVAILAAKVIPSAVAALAQAGAAPSRMALTFGALGAWMSVDGHNASAPVPRVQVADTVGAGDTFWGNCLADWAMSPNPATDAARVAETLRLAMLAAAINCSRAGCQPPTVAELLA